MQVHATHLLPMALTKELAVSSMPPLKVWDGPGNHSSHKSDLKGGVREGHRELCTTDPCVFAVPGITLEAHFNRR